jgi:hypothetical protein
MIALALIGAASLLSYALLAVWALVVWRRSRAPLPRVRPVVLYRPPLLSPHRLRHPVLWVDADTADEAWAVIAGGARW